MSNPYNLEFIEFKCGTFLVNRWDDLEEVEERLPEDAVLFGRSYFAEKRLVLHEARALFGQSKLRFEMTISHPRGNRGRIDIDFDQITGIEFDFDGIDDDESASGGLFYMTVQLSSPATCYIGRAFREIGVGLYRGTVDQRTKKLPSKFEDEQEDFSTDGAQIKASRIFTISVESAYRLQTMKIKMEGNPVLQAAIAAGVNPATATTNFTAEEVQASFEKPVNKKNPKKRAASGNENEGNNTDNGGASSSRAPPKLRKSNPKLLPGLCASAVPSGSGIWMKKCIQRWKLVAPFDPNVSEHCWEDYYKERASLDALTGKNVRSNPEGDSTPPAWTEDFPKPPMYPYSLLNDTIFQHDVEQHGKFIEEALKNLINGCPQLTSEFQDIGDRMASGIYVLKGYTKWNDDEECHKFKLYTRLYSPYGLGTSIDFQLDWVLHPKVGQRQPPDNIHIVSCWLACRDATDCTGLDPQFSALRDYDYCRFTRFQLFSMERYDSGYYQRSLLSPKVLRGVEESIFGQKNLLSERKLFSLLIHAAMGVRVEQISHDLHAMLRVSRRKWRLFVGESGDSSEDDADSDNESKKYIMQTGPLTEF